MTLDILAMYVIGFFLLFGAIFMLIGSIGLLRFKDTMTRLHGPTKASTLGVGALLFGSMLHSDVFGEGWSIHEGLIIAFLFVTAPIAANFLAKVAIHKGACETPPKPSNDDTWATLKVPEGEGEPAQAKQG